MVEYSMVTPNDYQTALAGEPGNYFKKTLGDPRKTAIRHIEEAHSAFGKGRRPTIRTGPAAADADRHRQHPFGDEIINGRRDCLLIATTDQPERFDPAIYRRFVEKGRIINIADFWKIPRQPERTGAPRTFAPQHPRCRDYEHPLQRRAPVCIVAPKKWTAP
ncbi:MAG: hypothetical protein U5R30_12765 [Deltaproteobacteria bacterium]|nr:hypothetical protein [Deltaproteobacteria bacterium]